MTGELPRRLAAEFAGTALLVGVGTGAIVAGARWGGAPSWEIAVAWFVAVAVPVFLFAGISGAHLNPAVTLALGACRRSPAREAVPYLLAQTSGAFVASATVAQFLGRSAHLGATVPNGVSLELVFGEEALFTFLLVAAVFVIAERGFGRGRWRLVLPAVVVGISTYLIGPSTGSSLNPARSLAPGDHSGTLTGFGAYVLAAIAAALLAALLMPPLLAQRPGSA